MLTWRIITWSILKNPKIYSKNGITSRKHLKADWFFDIMCEITLSIVIPKIRNGRGRSRKLWPNVRYADTLRSVVTGFSLGFYGEIRLVNQRILRKIDPRKLYLDFTELLTTLYYIVYICILTFKPTCIRQSADKGQWRFNKRQKGNH